MAEILAVQDGKRERAKAANRDAILKAAKRVFAEIGYETATVRDIIRGTELASGTFYNYFRSKEEVFEALAEDGARRFRPVLRAARESAVDFEDYIRRAITGYFQFLIAERIGEDGRPVSEMAPHFRTDTPEMKAVYEEVRLGLEDAIARGLAPPVDTDYLARACIGLSQDVGAAMLQRSPPDVEAAAAFAAQFIIGGVNALPRKR
ncbi:MAG: TetR/AcrR family transcriptional regulator [Hydrogenophilaceae bacterium]|jgi:AcrR family transcriptional regulator|nr:TetR/AcrR family transcriptional regulator [Hydrogenophilaceae bacterium]